jgi:hypothetical protein
MFPTELLKAVVAYIPSIAPCPDLVNLALTNRTLGTLATQQLYTSVTLDALRTLLERPEYANYVMRAHITWGVVEEEDDYEEEGDDDDDDEHADTNDEAENDGEHERGNVENAGVLPVPSDETLASLGMDARVVRKLRREDRAAQAALILHLLPVLQRLEITLPRRIKTFWHVFPGPVPTALRFPAGLVNLTEIIVEDGIDDDHFQSENSFTTLHLLPLLFLPSIRKLSFAKVYRDRVRWSAAHAALHGTSGITHLRLTNCRFAPAALDHILRMPNALEVLDYEHANPMFDGETEDKALEHVRGSLRTLKIRARFEDTVNSVYAGDIEGKLVGLPAFARLSELAVSRALLHKDVPLATLLPQGLHSLDTVLQPLWWHDVVSGAQELSAVVQSGAVARRLALRVVPSANYSKRAEQDAVRAAIADLGVACEKVGVLFVYDPATLDTYFERRTFRRT